MFEMQVPWWEHVVRGAAIYLVLLGMMRLSGKRTIGQFTPFDLLVIMLLSEAVSNGLSGGDDSVAGGLVSAATLVSLNAFLGFLRSHWKPFELLVEGRPVLLGRNGTVYDEVLKRERISRADVDEALRENDCRLAQMRAVFLETDGGISVVSKAGGS